LQSFADELSKDMKSGFEFWGCGSKQLLITEHFSAQVNVQNS